MDTGVGGGTGSTLACTAWVVGDVHEIMETTIMGGMPRAEQATCLERSRFWRKYMVYINIKLALNPEHKVSVWI